MEEVAERGPGTIRVVNPDLMEDFFGRICGRGLSFGRMRSFCSSLAGVRVGMMTLEGVCGACLWGDVTWNRVGFIENKNSIYRRIQSPRSVSFASLNGQCPFKIKKQRDPAF